MVNIKTEKKETKFDGEYVKFNVTDFKENDKIIIEINGDIRSCKKLGDLEEFNKDEEFSMTIGPSAFDPKKRFVIEATLGKSKIGRYHLIKKDNQTSLER